MGILKNSLKRTAQPPSGLRAREYSVRATTIEAIAKKFIETNLPGGEVVTFKGTSKGPKSAVHADVSDPEGVTRFLIMHSNPRTAPVVGIYTPRMKKPASLLAKALAKHGGYKDAPVVPVGDYDDALVQRQIAAKKAAREADAAKKYRTT